MKTSSASAALLAVILTVGSSASALAGVTLAPSGGLEKEISGGSDAPPVEVKPGKKTQPTLPQGGGDAPAPAKIQEKPAGTPKPSLMCRGKEATIVASPQGGTRSGTAGDDVIVGLGGPDVIDGGGGNDIICGGGGNDTLRGGNGADKIEGGPGNDTIYGEGGHDILKGGDGADRIYGGAGDDELYGENGGDILDGGSGNDILDGGAGLDSCSNPGNYFEKTTGCENFGGSTTPGVQFTLPAKTVPQETGFGSKVVARPGGLQVQPPKVETGKDPGDPQVVSPMVEAGKGVGFPQVPSPKVEVGKDVGDPQMVPPKVEVGEASRGEKMVKLRPEITSALPVPAGPYKFVDSTLVGTIRPGYHLSLVGKNFGSQPGKILMCGVPGGCVELEDPAWKSNTMVQGVIPLTTNGYPNGEVKLRIVLPSEPGSMFDVNVSNDHLMMFEGREQKPLAQADVVVLDCGTDSNYTVCNDESYSGTKFTPGCADCAIFGWHRNRAATTEDDEGTDHYSISLKNGWVLKSIAISTKRSSSVETIDPPVPPFPFGQSAWSPVIHWEVTPGDEIKYEYRIEVEGPLGSHYK